MEIHFLFLCLGIILNQKLVFCDVCKVNEEYQECGSSCPWTCSNFQDTIFCTKPCTKGCFCKPGYLLGPNKTCILPQDCPIGPCHENEVPTDCVNPCNDCAQRGKCTFEFCGRGCDCKQGFHRNSSGHCVEEKDCDVPEALCPKHEHFVTCVNQCNDCWSRGDCEQGFCHVGCDCNPGFFRDDNGDCISESQCIAEEMSCGVDEVYTDCVNPCNDCVKQGQCQHNCEYGCDCRKGYFRDSNNVCISAEQCEATLHPKRCRSCRNKCPVNQQYYVCIPTCRTTCENFNGTADHCEDGCRSGCFCKKGLVMRNDGVCCLPSECPEKCGINEEYSICGPACPESCENFGKSAMCTHQCVKGCFCKTGFVRGPRGICIQPQLCPIVCPENEEFQECATACPKTCYNHTNPSSCPIRCKQGCTCKPGYVRGPTLRCILLEQCPVVCRENEEFQECGTACPKTCYNYTNPSSCQNLCKKGCTCKPGYVKGPTLRCILPDQCPVVCQEREEYLECGPSCPSTCDDIGNASCAVPCTKGCFCRRGLVRGPKGKCIPPALCPVVCGENEEFKECGTACPLSCFNKTRQGLCPNKCVRGCFCKNNYVRDSTGKCILEQFCPVVCRDNEEYHRCGPACPITCDTVSRPTAPCPLSCTSGCFCKPGLVRDPNGKCILPTFCPVVCAQNEEFKECGPACPTTCHTLTRAHVPCPLPCTRGCFCKRGFVRGPDKNCVLPAFCPVVCRENEVFKECGSACPLTCSNITEQRPCPLICVKGCFCREGFVRDSTEKCISPQSCPVVCGENEMLKECGTACPATCDNPNQPQECQRPCMKGCFCRDGYIRNAKGKCVLPQNCPIVCGENEEFKECGSMCLANCTHPIEQFPCPTACVKGCFCRKGFFKNPQGKCVRLELCPVVCKANEFYQECGSACPLTCNDVGKPTAPCTLPCIRGCFCRPGYVRNIEGKCILPSFCPVVCGENEEFKECGSGCPANCTHPIEQFQCPTACVTGCFCRKGFFKNPQGKCVRLELCPVVCRENEQFLQCGSACPLTCDNIGSPNALCPFRCVKGCFCKPGYVRDRTGRCILPNFCPVVCGINEEFQECGTFCPANCTNRLQPQRLCPNLCVQGCFCKSGFVRNSTGKCILPTLCPVVCEVNEEFKECGPACPANCSNRGQLILCPAACKKGCFCKTDFVRDPSGRCVLPSQCPADCGPLEVFKECGPVCPANCTHPNPEPHTTPEACVRGCFCKEGLLRNPNGECVLPDSCPPNPQQCPPGETFYVCKPTCGGTCDTRNPQIRGYCTRVCQPGCFCLRGFVKTKDGRCVLPSQCPRPYEGRRIYSYDDETTSINPLQRTTTAQQSTNPTTLDTSIPATTSTTPTTLDTSIPATTSTTPTPSIETTSITTISEIPLSQAISRVQSTTLSTGLNTVSLPTTKSEIITSVPPSTTQEIETSSATSKTQTVSARTSNTLVTTTREVRSSVTTPLAY